MQSKWWRGPTVWYVANTVVVFFITCVYDWRTVYHLLATLAALGHATVIKYVDLILYINMSVLSVMYDNKL
jgi:hypothetical protein